MKPIERGEVLGLSDYEGIRGRFRERVIQEKKKRRVQLGPSVSAVFENRDTVLLQIQEMLRTERITKDAGIQHEIETYNQLVPGSRELSATLMIEIQDAAERDAFLSKAAGIEQHIALLVDGERIAATWEQSRVLPDRASAVLYVKFPLPFRATDAIRAKRAAVELLIDHPAYSARAPIGGVALASLAEDLEE
jgi:hypothetical protein